VTVSDPAYQPPAVTVSDPAYQSPAVTVSDPAYQSPAVTVSDPAYQPFTNAHQVDDHINLHASTSSSPPSDTELKGVTELEFRSILKDHLNPEQLEIAARTLGSTASKVLVKELDTSRPPPSREFSVTLKSETPSADAIRRFPIKDQIYIREQTDKLEKEDTIERTSSAYRAPLVLVKKKNGDIRMCVDYSMLNDNTVRDLHPLPNIDDLFTSLKRARYYTTLDLAAGYWQIVVKPSDRHKLAFHTPHGQFTWKRMPFGLTNAPAFFQRLMNETLSEHIASGFVMVYLDDIIIFSDTFEQHLQHVLWVLETLNKANLQAKWSKCKFFQQEVNYLGFIINNGTIRTDPATIAPITECHAPRNVLQLQKFLGKCNYFRKFIPKFSDIAEPLYKLTRKDANFVWTQQCQAAFVNLKEALTSRNQVLTIADVRPSSPPFIIYTDASDVAVGAVLSQMEEGEEHFDINKVYKPIAYYSKVMLPAERNYSATERECLAMVKSIEFFNHFLYNKFYVVTDHSALVHLHPNHKASPRVHRWSIRLLGHQFTVFHKPGVNHVNADALTRSPFIHVSDGEVVPELLNESSPQVKLAFLTLDNLTAIPDIDWPKEQAQDDLCKKIVEFSNGSLSKTDPLFSSIAKWSPNIIIENSTIYMKEKDKKLRIVPSHLRQSLIHLSHGDLLHGVHMSSVKTFKRLSKSFWWPHMQVHITRVIKNCITCESKSNRRPGNYAAELSPIITLKPWHTIGMDIAGPLPSSNGNKYFLLVIDLFTKWVEAIPIKDIKAKTIIDVLLTHIIARHGIPSAIITDKASNLNSADFQSIYNYFRINKKTSTAQHQQTDGAAERAIGTIKRLFLGYSRVFAFDLKEKWADFLPFAVSSYNSTIHRSIKMSPFEANYGRSIRTIDDLVADIEINSINDPKQSASEIFNTYIFHLHNRLRNIHSYIISNTRDAQASYKRYYDKIHQRPTYQPGDAVWRVDAPDTSLNITESHRRGPYLVKEVLEHGVIIIQHGLHKDNTYKTNVARLEPVRAELQSISPEEFAKAPQLSSFVPREPDQSVSDIMLTHGTNFSTQVQWSSFRDQLYGYRMLLFADAKNDTALQATRATLWEFVAQHQIARPPPEKMEELERFIIREPITELLSYLDSILDDLKRVYPNYNPDPGMEADTTQLINNRKRLQNRRGGR